MKHIIASWAVFFTLLAGTLQAQQIFVLYDAGCMLRVEYEQVINQQPKMAYFSYQLPVAEGGAKLILETGVEGNDTAKLFASRLS
ncbi:MAG: hypothetical protein HC821_04555 [Lewinella sp.]|nr:hypothetical protein [Lewinella sp.]